MLMFFASALGWFRTAAQALWAFVLRYPAGAIAIVALCLAVWLWNGKRGALEERDLARAQTAEIIKASEEAELLAIAAKAEAERKYRDKANASDLNYKAQLADARSAVDGYIARNRLRPQDGGSCRQAAAGPNGGSAGVSEPVPADSFVAVSDSDVRACSAATIYAVEAFKWSSGLKAD